MTNFIVISELEVHSRIGTTADERSKPQRLTVNLSIVPRHGFTGLGDSIERTVDYVEVCEMVRTLSATGERNLIETLTEEIVREILAHFDVYSVEVELRKFILPDTRYVAVKLMRSAEDARTVPE
jgi:dihydroneopterin aldolase